MIGIIKFAALFSVAATMVSALEELAVLPQEDRAEWSAVGVVTSNGPNGPVTCTGTLVAPDLIVTAVHCVAHKFGLMEGIRFIAGLNGNRRVATSSTVEVLRFPVWDYTTGQNKLRYDLAVLRLGRLIPDNKVSAMKLFPKDTDLPNQGALLGYQDSADKSLHGHFSCSLKRSQTTSTIASDCSAVSGNSGGPVLVKKGGEWRLAGIIVARNETSGTSVLVEVNHWLRERVRAAQNREALRAAVVE